MRISRRAEESAEERENQQKGERIGRRVEESREKMGDITLVSESTLGKVPLILAVIRINTFFYEKLLPEGGVADE
ncbi:hypothetical protein [Lentibacillus salicampi]|uniref:Uncharacterized protein n=1 Tax=Lentibacillus salicampi TaxID=175306 RepID=A0A4Y9ADS5_9BACI|nr:hypothetical protein [Lentibacillus salicampi]TFJ93575.1 hypothetical protein E4U82_06345 [Lentibacillus salicampi]